MVMMPNGAAACRAAQKAAMAGILYDKQTNPELGEVLQKLQGVQSSSNFDSFQRAVIREARRCVPCCTFTCNICEHMTARSRLMQPGWWFRGFLDQQKSETSVWSPERGAEGRHSIAGCASGSVIIFDLVCFRDWVRTVKIPKRIAKRRAELESEGYQVCHCTHHSLIFLNGPAVCPLDTLLLQAYFVHASGLCCMFDARITFAKYVKIGMPLFRLQTLHASWQCGISGCSANSAALWLDLSVIIASTL